MKLADVKMPFVRLKQFQKEHYSVIYLEPEECFELRETHRVFYSFFQRLTKLKEDWKYNPKKWNPHLTIGRLEKGRISDEALVSMSNGLSLAGAINTLLVLLGPNELKTVELKPK